MLSHTAYIVNFWKVLESKLAIFISPLKIFIPFEQVVLLVGI